jgi:hypothetical protein
MSLSNQPKRFSIRRESIDTFALPLPPEVPEQIKRNPIWREYDEAWKEWRRRSEQVLSGALTKLKYDSKILELEKRIEALESK